MYSEDIFNKKHIIVLGNGVYDFNDHQFKPYEYFYYATRKLPWLYNPDSQCLPILEALHSWLDEEDVRIFLELIGYCLYPDYNIHSSFWLTGKGGNGKTTAMNLLVHFLRPENITAMKPQLFIEETVATARLSGKLANIGDDIPSAPLKDGGDLKKLTGYSPVEGRILYKGFFEFYNTAKMIFACQTIPASNDDSDAWYRRAIRLQFSKQFLGKDKDPDYLKKLTNSELMSGLLNLSLLNLKNLLKRGDFETDFNLEEKKRNYIMASDPAKAFITYGIILDQDYKIKYEEAYEEFKDFCKVFKLDPVSKNKFTIAINQWGTGIRINRLREKDEITKEKIRTRYLVGCSTKKRIIGDWSSDVEEIKKSSGLSGPSDPTLPILNRQLKNSTKSYRLFPKHPTKPPRQPTSKVSTKNFKEVKIPEDLFPEVEKLILRFDDGEGAERNEIIEKIISSDYNLNGSVVKYTREQIEDCFFCLTYDGKAYEPRPGYIRKQV